MASDILDSQPIEERMELDNTVSEMRHSRDSSACGVLNDCLSVFLFVESRLTELATRYKEAADKGVRVSENITISIGS